MIKFIIKGILRDKSKSLIPIAVISVGVMVTIMMSGFLEGIFSDVVSDISFELEKGKTFGIVGESGSGKSVSTSVIMGLQRFAGGRVTNGHIWFESPTLGRVDLTQLSDADFRKIRGKEIAMIFQDPMTALNPVKRCGEQVAEVLKNSHVFVQKRNQCQGIGAI